MGGGGEASYTHSSIGHVYYTGIGIKEGEWGKRERKEGKEREEGEEGRQERGDWRIDSPSGWSISP